MNDKEFERKLKTILFEMFFEGSEKMEDEPVKEIEMKQMSDQFEEELARIHKSDPVNHPQHYGGKYETIDVIRDILETETDAKVGYYIGNVIKYISRYRKKGNPVQDLQKAQVYLGWAVKRLEELG